MSIERKVTPQFPFSFKISILNIILTNRPHFHQEIQYSPWKACVLQKMRICKQCIIKKLTQCCINTLTVCLARGFRTRTCGKTEMGTWGTNFNNSFVSLDDWRNCKLIGVNKHEIYRSQILALNPINIGIIWLIRKTRYFLLSVPSWDCIYKSETTEIFPFSPNFPPYISSHIIHSQSHITSSKTKCSKLFIFSCNFL